MKLTVRSLWINRILDIFAGYLNTPLYRNAYSLVLSSFSTSGLGVIYWILAARFYSAEDLGLNAAVLSSMLFLSNIAQFNLTNALNRFLPSAGRPTGRLIGISYLVNVVAGVLISLIFLLGLSVWAPKLSFLTSSPLLIIGYVLFTVSWGIFALQDSALTGMRQAVWIPIENIAFSVLKIILLVVFASLIPTIGVLASWMVPILIAVLIINAFLFRSLVPRHIAATQADSEPIKLKGVAQYVAADYIGSLFWVAATTLQTIIVTQMISAEASAYFYSPWQIAYALFLVSRLMGMSLVTEVAADSTKLNTYSIKILKQIAVLILPAVAIILLFAPHILQVFGTEYAQNSSNLLRLLSLTAIPQIVISLYLSMARIQQNKVALVIVPIASSVFAIILMVLFLPRMGIDGLGTAWLISQAIVALALIIGPLKAIIFMHLNLNLPLAIIGKIREVWMMGQKKRRIEKLNQIVHQLQPDHPSLIGSPANVGWQAQSIFPSQTDVTVVTLCAQDQPDQALLKIANSRPAAASLRHHAQVISALHEDLRLEGFQRLLPRVIASGSVNGKFYLIEEMLPGVDARAVIKRPETCARLLDTAAETILALHKNTVSTVVVNQSLLNSWVDDRLKTFRKLNLNQLASSAKNDDRLKRLADELYTGLEGRVLPISWIHGDYSPGNILVTQDGSRVIGLIDWDLASPHDYPQIDLVHLLLSVRILQTNCELGNVLLSLLHENRWSAEEQAILDRTQRELPGEPLDLRNQLLLTWIRHIASNLSKSDRYVKHWLWSTKNVEAVLGSLY